MIALVIGAAVIVFLNRGNIGEALSAGKKSTGYTGDPFTFESGSRQVCAPVGNGLALASTNGIQLLDSGGSTAAKQVYSMKTPALTVCDTKAAAYDVGGTGICTVDMKGNVTQTVSDDPIISAAMNENGWLTVCTQASGYKGRATVYNADGQAVYQWNSGEGYLLKAEVSPGGKYLAALCAGESGGAVHLFALSSEKEQGAFTTPNELLTDMHWLTENRVCVLSQSRCAVIDRTGEQKGNYDFAGLYLTDYSFGGDGFAVLMLGKYRTGGTGTLMSVGSDGKLMGQAEIASELISITAHKKYVAALCSDGVKLFTQSMSLAGSGENTAGVKSAVPRLKGDVLLVSSYYAEIRSF